jgi:predicted DNA-binding transcriptional regulator YafY
VATFTGPGQGGGELVDIDLYDEESLFVADAKGLDRPIRFDLNTGLEILSGLHYLIQLPGVVDTTALEQFIAKLQKAFGVNAIPFEVSNSESIDQIAISLAKAINQDEAVEIEYAAGNTGRFTTRVIEPKKITISEDVRYVVAYCHAALAERTFRLDRIKNLVFTNRKANSDTNPQTSTGLESGQIDVTIECSNPAVLEFHPRIIKSKRAVTETTVELVIAVHDLEWIIREILASGGQIKPVAPSELARRIKEKISTWQALNNIS